MIIGTAGHIDHGKTSLVKALTGTDTDRLKEEKARGITIDLGFAYKPHAEAGVIGFVDVPGHEKLVRNMLAGATGIDCVLLVVAADDGPMPQTREHLAILDLLGLDRGVVALTKTDLVTPERLAAAVAEVRALIAPTGLAGAEVVPVSSVTGDGVAALESRLVAAGRGAADRPATESVAGEAAPFRLAVDRSFSLAGAGTVVTGTALAGRVAVGDRLVVSPSGKPVRVRGLHAQNREAASAGAGARVALNLAGVDKSDVARGDWIVAEPAHAPTTRLDVRLRVLAGEGKPLAHWTPVHLHLGATDVGARVALLEGRAVEPGASALVQLELERPIGALYGDRFVLRDQSAQRTLGGGFVIDPFADVARVRGRRRPAYRAALEALAAPDAAHALAALLALEVPDGVDLERFARARNLSAAARAGLEAGVPQRRAGVGAAARSFAPGQVERFGKRVADVLAGHHRRTPDSPGVGSEALQHALGTGKPSPPVVALLLRELIVGGSIERSGPYLRLAGHAAALLPAEQKVWERVKPWLDEGGTHPPKLSELLARDRALPREAVLRVLNKLAKMGRLYPVGAEYFVQPQHMLALASQAQALAERDAQRRLNVKELREASGISRHLSMPLVEFFDAIGFTKRDAVGRHIRRDARRLFDAHD